MFWTYS